MFFVNYNKDIDIIDDIYSRNIEYKKQIDSLQSILDKKTIDEQYYSDIDTVVMNYDWGKEEIFIYKYN